MNPSKALKKFNTLADVEFQSRTQNRLLVVYKEIVYDLTTFSSRHPGGAAAIMDHKGKVIDNVIFNPSYYKHNPRILDKMAQFKVGYIEPPAVQKTNQPAKIVPQQQQIKAVSSSAVKDTQLQKNSPNQQKLQEQAPSQSKPGNYPQQQQPQQIIKQQSNQQQQQQYSQLLQQQQQQAKYEAEKKLMLQKQQQQQQQQQSVKHNSQYQISSSSAVQQQPQLKQSQSQPSSQRLIKSQQQQSSASSSMKLQQQQSQQPPARERESSLGKQLADEIAAGQANKTNATSNTNTHNNNNMHTSIHLEDNDQKDKLNVSKTTKMSITSDRSIKGVKDFLMTAEQHRLPSTIPDLNQLQILSNKSIPHPEDSNTPTNSLFKDTATPKLSNYHSSEVHKVVNPDNVNDGFQLTNLKDPFEECNEIEIPSDENIRINALPPLLPTILSNRKH